MKPLAIAIPLLALVSCDKAKDIAEKATATVKDQIATQTGRTSASKMDPELQKLVDQTPEGVVFRKDLPFPRSLEVRVTRRREMSGRFYQESAIEKRSDTVKGTQIEIHKLERAGDQVRHTLEQSSFSIPTPDKPDVQQASANPLEQVAPSSRPVTFRKTGGTWKSDDRDGFRAAVLSKQLSPVFDELLVENGLAPRPLWFAKRRIKIGDELTLTGESLPILLAGRAKGSFKLKLESLDAAAGHPCGVFAVTGDYSRKQFPDFEGNLIDEDVSIQSGKIWLSLIHPLVLREELETVQTFKSGGHGNPATRGQGTVKVSFNLDWKPVAR
jgi:hypothetical protein